MWPSPSRLGWAGVLQCVRLCGLASAGGNSLRGLHSGAGGVGLGLLGCVRGAWVGHWVGWACRGARGSSRRVCAGCRVLGVVRGVRRVGAVACFYCSRRFWSAGWSFSAGARRRRTIPRRVTLMSVSCVRSWPHSMGGIQMCWP